MNYLLIGGVTLGSFIAGAIWYGPLFGGVWRKIHGVTQPTKEDMQGIWKLMLSEFLSTLLMITVLSFFIGVLGSYDGASIGFLIWLGFGVPMTISDIIWGKDPKKYMPIKIGIMLIFKLIILVSAGYILGI